MYSVIFGLTTMGLLVVAFVSSSKRRKRLRYLVGFTATQVAFHAVSWKSMFCDYWHAKYNKIGIECKFVTCSK